jgi:hypothetical protein
MEPEGSIQCSQEPSTGPYPKQHQSNPHHLYKIHFNIVHPPTSWSFRWLFPSDFPTNILRVYLFSLILTTCPFPSQPSWLDHSNYNLPIVAEHICRYVQYSSLYNYNIWQHVSTFSSRRQVMYLCIRLFTWMAIAPHTGQCTTYGRGCVVLLPKNPIIFRLVLLTILFFLLSFM